MKTGMRHVLLVLNVIILIHLSYALQAQDHPNVVFILADDLGVGDISYNNQDPDWFRYTPNIDSICKQGIYFSNYSVHHVCSPTRAGLLTGMHYTKVGSGSETGGTLHNDIPNVAKDFKKNGYVTGAFGKWHNGAPNFPVDGNGAVVSKLSEIDSSNNIFEILEKKSWGEGVNAYGFDKWTGYYSGGGDYFNRFVNAHHEYDWWIDQHYRPDVAGYTTDLIGEAAVEFISNNKDTSFYCYVPMEAVHAPYQVKLTDLQELCGYFPGEWDYIKDVVSPVTGRKISEVSRIRCNPGAEFDHTIIDPETTRFTRLIYSTMVYSMDKAIGNILKTLDEHGLSDNTIVFFSSDNGATTQGSNGIFQGSKHTLWEGGIHVPAAIWWPGNIDAVSLNNYAPGDNLYGGYVQFIDYYPTIMTLTNSSISATNLDGIDFSEGLRNRTEARKEFESPYFGINTEWGVVKTGKWKLHYNEIPDVQVLQLYDLETDPGETINQVATQPEILNALKGLYNNWVDENNFAFSYLPVPMDKISDKEPVPEGDILEVEAWQTDTIGDAFFVRFSNFGEGGNDPGDRIEFDIFVPGDSDNDSGFHFTPAGGPRPYYVENNGVTQDSIYLVNAKWPRRKWVRNVLGYGNHAPIGGYANYIAFHATKAGYTHFYLDNIIVRKNDGTVLTIWKDNGDFDNIRYRYQDIQYSNYADVQSIDGFSFADVRLNTVMLDNLIYLHVKNTVNDITLEDTEIFSLGDVFEVNGLPNALIDIFLDTWTNTGLLDVIHNSDNDEILLTRKSDTGGESEVTIAGAFNGDTVYTSFNVHIDPIYTLQIKNSIEDVSLNDSVRISLDSVFEVVNYPSPDIEIGIDDWSNRELLDVTYESLANSLLLARKSNQGGRSRVDLTASFADESLGTSFNVDILPLGSPGFNAGNRNAFLIYPNPADSHIYFQSDAENITVEVYSSAGIKIGTEINQKKMDVSGFEPGFYIVRINYDTYIQLEKLLIKR